MKKTKAATARAALPTPRRRVTKATAALDDALAESAAPAGTGGVSESPVLIAVANLVRSYVRWQLDEA
jgi:hypothetical protein